MENKLYMKTLKFPAQAVTTKKYNATPSINDNVRTTVDEISKQKKIYDTPISRSQLSNSRKFRIALFATYSSLLAIFAIIVYTAVVLDPKFPF